jgi:hypothetical protein
MVPFDSKGRSILDEWVIESLSMYLSLDRKHTEPRDIADDMQDVRDVLGRITTMNMVVIPQGVLESIINGARKALAGSPKE